MNAPKKRTTTQSLMKMKSQGKKISMLTAYDYTMACLLDQADVDVLLVGDSLSMVFQGNETTIPVTLDEMIYHGKCVVRGSQNAMVVVDLPFPHGQLGWRKTLEVSARIMKETGCGAVKLEGGAEQAETIHNLVAAGIPLIAHVGLRPQSVHAIGGYRVARDAEKLREDALAAQSAGAFCVLMECVPSELAADITDLLDVPTIGIGAGSGCDGQVLVTADMLGMTVGRVPKFVRQFADLKGQISGAVEQYNRAVGSGQFPSAEESFE